MNQTTNPPADDLLHGPAVAAGATDRHAMNPAAAAVPSSRHASAVSWGAIIAGAAAAASLSLILLLLGVGLGMSAVSPWADEGVTATTFGVSTILWLTLTQIAAAGMGGYLAGRLRSRWLGTPADEVYFRDTAHGFLAWAVATLVTAGLLTSAVGSVVGAGAQAGASLASGAAATVTTVAGAAAGSGAITAGDSEGPIRYFVDSLFRRDSASAGTDTRANVGTDAAGTTALTGAGRPSRSENQDAAEIARIFMQAGLDAKLPPEDVRHIAQRVAARTGMTQVEAERRVAEVHARAQQAVQQAETSAREAADAAREASAYAALWLFISLLAGAFFASLAATFGGRQRDA